MRIVTDGQSKRMWFYFGENNICFELGDRLLMLGASLSIDTEDITLALHLLKSFYISFDFTFIRKFLNKHPNYSYNYSTMKGSYWQKREIGIDFNLRDWTIGIDFWTNPDEWKAGDRHWYANLADIIFGKRNYTAITEKEGDTVIEMPEGAYPARYKIFTSFWKRPRWLFSTSQKRITIDVPKTIPFPGKGESSWDMGDDGVSSITMPMSKYETLREATNKFALSVLKDRQKYGSLNYKPKEGFAI